MVMCKWFNLKNKLKELDKLIEYTFYYVFPTSKEILIALIWFYIFKTRLKSLAAINNKKKQHKEKAFQCKMFSLYAIISMTKWYYFFVFFLFFFSRIKSKGTKKRAEAHWSENIDLKSVIKCRHNQRCVFHTWLWDPQ